MNNASTLIDPDVQSWLDTYYIKLTPEALYDLLRFLHPELNVQEWAAQHYIKLPADAESALASLLGARTGCLTATLVSDGQGTALPDFSTEHRCSDSDQKFLDLRHRIAELQSRNAQLEAAYLGISAGEHPVTPAETLVEQLLAATGVHAVAGSDVDTDQGTEVAQQVAQHNKNQHAKFRVKNKR